MHDNQVQQTALTVLVNIFCTVLSKHVVTINGHRVLIYLFNASKNILINFNIFNFNYMPNLGCCNYSTGTELTLCSQDFSILQ